MDIEKRSEITGLKHHVFPPVEDTKIIQITNKSDVKASRGVRRKAERDHEAALAKFREIRKRFDELMLGINWDEVRDELYDEYINVFSGHWQQFANSWNARSSKLLFVNERAFYDYAKNQDLKIEY